MWPAANKQTNVSSTSWNDIFTIVFFFYGVAFKRSVLSYGILNAASGHIPAKTFVLDAVPLRAYNYSSIGSRSTVVFNLKFPSVSETTDIAPSGMLFRAFVWEQQLSSDLTAASNALLVGLPTYSEKRFKETIFLLAYIRNAIEKDTITKEPISPSPSISQSPLFLQTLSIYCKQAIRISSIYI